MGNDIYEICEGIEYIGVYDRYLDLFESQYSVPEGITYNSYLLKGKKTAVVDTTDGHTGEEWLINLRHALGDRKPDYLVIEHLEPDHSALIDTFMQIYPEATLIMSATAQRMLPNYFDPMPDGIKIMSMKEGDELDLGGMTLKFIMAPMVHWPEVMMAYLPERKTLFTADGFGTFGPGKDADEDWAKEARRYYYNIVGKYGAQVQNVLKKASGLEIERICPLHGPVITEGICEKVALYDTWSSYRSEKDGVLIPVASIHGNTLAAAECLADSLREEGVKEVEVIDLTRCDMSEAVAMAFMYPKLVMCASSYDAGLFTPMYNFLHTLQIKGYRDRKVALIENGSWAPSAAKVMRGMLGEMKGIDIMPETLTINGILKDSDCDRIDEFAKIVKKL